MGRNAVLLSKDWSMRRLLVDAEMDSSMPLSTTVLTGALIRDLNSFLVGTLTHGLIDVALFDEGR